MCRLVSVAFLVFLVAGRSSGVKWVQMTAGDPLPPGTVAFPDTREYVGRARHFNDILPAKVSEYATATIEVCDKTVTKHQFEVLTSTTPCSWQRLEAAQNLPEGLVRVGHRDAMSALFLSWSNGYYYNQNSNNLYAFSLSDADIQYVLTNGFNALVCPTERQWIDVSAKEVPKNAVFAGKSTDGKDVYVARLQKKCVIYPGEVVADEGVATAWTGGEMIEGRYCQVLTGDSDRYRWVPITEDDELPDNAVVGSTDKRNLFYIAHQLATNTTTYVTDLFKIVAGGYELLIDNGKPEPPLDSMILDHDYDDDLK